ncbi:MAG: DUF3560 domain-containing protein [Magnetococcus sp. YQC-3]
METWSERRARKLERAQELAEKHRKLSEQKGRSASQIASMIPMGQPILVGHHSERRHRKDLERIDNSMRASIEHDKKADYYESKAASIENNRSIMSDDPNAIDKLKEKLAKLETKQENNKTVNALVRKSKGNLETLITLFRAHFPDWKDHEKAAKAVLTPDCFGNLGIPSFTLSNNSAEIRRLKKRIEQQEKIETHSQSFEPIEGSKGRIELEENYFLVYFNEKPSEEIRKILKSYPLSLKWSPRNTAWVRKQTVSTGDYFLNELKKVIL